MDRELVGFRAGPHLADDLEHLRICHGLSAAGAARYGLRWLLDWWRDSHPSETLSTLPGAHLPELSLVPADQIRFDHGPDSRERRFRLSADDRWLAAVLSDLADTPLEDVLRHAICVARTVLDGGTGVADDPILQLDPA